MRCSRVRWWPALFVPDGNRLADAAYAAMLAFIVACVDTLRRQNADARLGSDETGLAELAPRPRTTSRSLMAGHTTRLCPSLLSQLPRPLRTQPRALRVPWFRATPLRSAALSPSTSKRMGRARSI